jgi:ubiquinone/menaquinone biosynthesis C-methylase UbiE
MHSGGFHTASARRYPETLKTKRFPMEGLEYIYEICEALPRSGPGDNEYTRRAFNTIPKLQTPPFILDIGCGQGMQTIELAKISNGKITALDNYQPFLDLLVEQAKKQKIEEKIFPKNISMLDMDFEEETFDIIWSEGALYFMGFQNGLKRCHQLLKTKGYLAVTELVYITPNPPAPVVEYCGSEYPDIKNIEKNIEIIRKEGFSLISNFTLPESAWLDSYYLPMEKEMPRLNEKYEGNEVALAILKGFQSEADFYRKYSNFYGYEFFIMKKK